MIACFSFFFSPRERIFLIHVYVQVVGKKYHVRLPEKKNTLFGFQASLLIFHLLHNASTV